MANQLIGIGTNANISGQIIDVYARQWTEYFGSGTIGSTATITYSSETLGTVLAGASFLGTGSQTDPERYGPWVKLDAPTGGWTTTAVSGMTASFAQVVGGSMEIASHIDVLVISSSPSGPGGSFLQFFIP